MNCNHPSYSMVNTTNVKLHIYSIRREEVTITSHWKHGKISQLIKPTGIPEGIPHFQMISQVMKSEGGWGWRLGWLGLEVGVVGVGGWGGWGWRLGWLVHLSHSIATTRYVWICN
jgi:hypothetical protein